MRGAGNAGLGGLFFVLSGFLSRDTAPDFPKGVSTFFSKFLRAKGAPHLADLLRGALSCVIVKLFAPSMRSTAPAFGLTFVSTCKNIVLCSSGADPLVWSNWYTAVEEQFYLSGPAAISIQKSTLAKSVPRLSVDLSRRPAPAFRGARRVINFLRPGGCDSPFGSLRRFGSVSRDAQSRAHSRVSILRTACAGVLLARS